jgi:putative thiamine transport system permease protein
MAGVALPMLWSLWGAVAAGWDAEAWQALAQEPLLLQALTLTLWTGLSSSALAVGVTASLLCATVGQRPDNAAHPLSRWLAPLLAVPHAAFAIGLVALLAPSGWLLRLLSPWATGLSAPPPWPTTQDPWGLGLIAVLVLKEVPFLLWAALAHLQRPDVARRLQQELRLAHTLGYSAAQAWWRVGWPQLLPRLRAPLLAVLAYGLTVVDVALIIGPTAPPTLAMLTWQWLQDADPATNAQGAAAAWVLALVLAACAAALWAAIRWRGWRTRWTRGYTPGHAPAHSTPRQRTHPYVISTPWPVAMLLAVYAMVMLALLMGSITGPWPFPDVLPMAWTPTAWRSVAGSHHSIWTTVWLGLASACAALVWAVAWLEWAPSRWQQRMAALWMLPLVLPAVLWVVGLHRLSLAWGLDTTATGMWLAHTLACLPYVLIALQGPYLGFDRRLQQVSATLGHPHAVFLLRVKWPLLRAPLAAALAVGFAVSVAQYLPTLYVGAGRFQTITTEAVTLAAGGQRSLSAAFAWLQWMLPVLVFSLAAWAGKARQWPIHSRVSAQSGHDA